MAEKGNKVLDVQKISISFGGLTAVSDVSFEVYQGELIGLIGPNGAGKTTIFNMLTGVYVPTSGRIIYNNKANEELVANGIAPFKISRYGISRTFQNIRLFKQMTVLDNIRISMHKDIEYSFLGAMFKSNQYLRTEQRFYDRAVELLKFVSLDEKKFEFASNLPYGEQRKLEIARAVATGAEVIFLDEPAAGMNPAETEELVGLVRKLKEEFGLTIVLIEHDMKFVMNICERIYVLDFGILIAEGKPHEIKSDPKVIKAYLGEEI